MDKCFGGGRVELVVEGPARVILPTSGYLELSYWHSRVIIMWVYGFVRWWAIFKWSNDLVFGTKNIQ